MALILVGGLFELVVFAVAVDVAAEQDEKSMPIWRSVDEMKLAKTAPCYYEIVNIIAYS